MYRQQPDVSSHGRMGPGSHGVCFTNLESLGLRIPELSAKSLKHGPRVLYRTFSDAVLPLNF